MPDQAKTSPEHTIEVALDTAASAADGARDDGSKGRQQMHAEAEKRRAETAKAVRLPDAPHGGK